MSHKLEQATAEPGQCAWLKLLETANSISMKNRILLVTSVLVSAAFFAGCKPAADQPASQSTATEQLNKAQAAVKEAANDMKDYSFAEKAEFVTTMQAKLAELTRNLDELSAKIESSSDAVKADARPKFAALREQTARLNAQLDAAKGATATTWETIKSDAHNSFVALKDGFAQTRQWASDKIAP